MSISYTLDKRCTEILNIVMYTIGYLKIQDLADDLEVSKRSVYYDISKINEWLIDNGIDSIIQERGKGIILHKEQVQAIQKTLNQTKSESILIFTPEERQRIEICTIIVRNHPLYIEDFMDTCQVSRNTIINDLKSVDTFLENYALQLTYNIKDGYRINGDIIKKRAVFFMLFPSLWHFYENHVIETFDAQKVYDILNTLKKIESELHAEYVSGILPALAVFLSTIQNRNDEISFSDMDEEEIIETNEYHLINKYFPNLKDHEKIYIALHLLGSRLQTIPVNVMKEEDKTYEFAKALVHEFERISYVFYDREEELINAINAHLKTSLYRFKYGIQLGNPMLNNIKTEYEELFELTKRACKILENDLDSLISDAEVAYLTLHFGAFMPTKKANKHAFRIMIICPNGIGTGNMLRQEVSTLVPQATEIKNIPLSSYRPNHDYDVVISTVMLANEQRLIMVHPILTDQDRVAILRNCMATEPQAKMQIDDILKIASNYIIPDQLNDFHKNLQDYYSSIQVQKVPHKTYDRGLLDFLKVSHIQCVNSKVSWEEAIHISAQPLLDDGSISNDYVNAIINDQKNKGLYMFLADDLVLAHSAIENGVNRLDVSMCTFKEPVPFLNGQNARIILVLCAEDKTKHIHVLNDMLNIFSKKKSIDQIASLNSPAEIYSYIDKHIEK